MLATVLALVALIPVGAASMITGDFSQMVYKPTRRRVHWFLKRRRLVIGASAALWLLALSAHLAVGETNVVLLVVTGVLVALFTLLGYGMSPYVMFPSLRGPQWMSAEQAGSMIGDEEDVIGVEINGDARAFPISWSFRPHLIQDTIGGEPVLMSYCLLSNYGIAFRAELDGEPMHCIMPIQWENNMVIYDTAGDRLIQQIEGKVLYGEGVGRSLDSYPTQIMPWSAWQRLHPETKVLHNPPAGVWDRFVRRFIGTQFLEENRRREEPMFPTIDTIDERLPSKAEVVGVEAGGVYRAYPADRVAQASVVNDEISGVPIVVVALGGGIAVFERSFGDQVLEFSSQGGETFRDASGSEWNMRGEAVSGPLQGRSLHPYRHYSRVLWFVWSNFFPNTEVADLSV
ncbi:MAG: DUF3179 domain-containing (seleno)protein [Acidimicrobiia bacterium]